MNEVAVEQAVAGLHAVEYDVEKWMGPTELLENGPALNAESVAVDAATPDFVKKVVLPMLALKVGNGIRNSESQTPKRKRRGRQVVP
jgi:hypothetical protein